MIQVTKAPNADSRTWSKNSDINDVRNDTVRHIIDVNKGLKFLAEKLEEKGSTHDHTKLENLGVFYGALKSGHIKDTEWYRKHITEERHHLKMHIPEDVNLLDVIEHLTDCTMAGLTRSGEIYDIDLDPGLLVLAAQNTVELLKQNIEVIESNKGGNKDGNI